MIVELFGCDIYHQQPSFDKSTLYLFIYLVESSAYTLVAFKALEPDKSLIESMMASNTKAVKKMVHNIYRT